VRPNARENDQISPSIAVRTARGESSSSAPPACLARTPEKRKNSRRFGFIWRISAEAYAHPDGYQHQTGYNKTFASEFQKLGWEMQPMLRTKPKLIGDFRKGLVFGEVQFGNSATLYRDYYKFQYSSIPCCPYRAD
jgi:hypothetical protein